MNHRKLIISAIFSLICFAPILVFAIEPALEIKYPDLPPLATGPTSASTELAVYVRYIYIFVVSISGMAAVAMLILGGLQYMSSAGSPQKLGEAKEKITSSVLGVVILACSALILGTIDPNFLKLTNPKVSNLAPSLSPGVYICKERAYFKELWDGLKKAKTYPELSDAYAKELNGYRATIDKNCQLIVSGGTVDKQFENKITEIYLVPVEKVREYGAVLYEESSYQGKAAVVYGNGNNDGKNANSEPQEWPVPGMKISSVRPFYLVYKPDYSWYAELYYLVNYNRDNSSAPKVTCRAENATEADCDLSNFVIPEENRMCGGPSPSPVAFVSLAQQIDPNIEKDLDALDATNKNNTGGNTATPNTNTTAPTDNDYKTPPASSYNGCAGFPKIASAKIEGSYFAVFFRDKVEEWTTDVDIDIIIPNGDANNYDNLMGKWNEACKERTAEEPQGSRYPCATDAEVISGVFY